MGLPRFTRRIALALLALAPALVAGAAAIWAVDQERAAADEMLRARVKQLIARVDAELNRTVAILKTISVSSVLQSGDMQGFHALAVQVVASEPQWENVQLIGSKGEHLVNARLPYGAAPPLNRPLPPGVNAALLDRHHFVITSTLDSTSSGLPGPVQATPAPTLPGELSGDIKQMRSHSREKLYVAEETSTFSGWKVITFMPRKQAGVLHEHLSLLLALGAGGLVVYWAYCG